MLDTLGIDVHNTTRFNVGDWRNAVTLGVDAFQDDVRTSDSRGNSNITTPSGLRTVSGGFAQLKQNYSTWFEVISAIRYDRYDLHSPTVATGGGGDRFSPKMTVGVTPVAGFTPYVSYAEGYRAPSITETLISGAHATGGGPAFFNCPDGTVGLFCFLPNPNLRPEVGKNKEVGLNLKYNDIFTAGDSFRGKFNVFRNDVDGYIDLVASHAGSRCRRSARSRQFFQYQNIAHARIEGVEAETMYDAGPVVCRRRRSPDPRQERRDQYRARDHHAAQDHHDRRRAAARSQADPGGAVDARSAPTTTCPPAICLRPGMSWSIST